MESDFLYIISYEIKRFGELYRMIDGTSKKMPTDQLRESESDNIVQREVRRIDIKSRVLND